MPNAPNLAAFPSPFHLTPHRTRSTSPLPGPSPLVPIAVELPVGRQVRIGRRSHPSLNNLHISRDQAMFELKQDEEGKILICVTNVSTRRLLFPLS